jgi:hypothetical protein
VVDASSSSGNDGREWLKVFWSVTSSSDDEASVNSIVAILNSSDLSYPIEIPASLLQAEKTYRVHEF